MFSSGVIHSDAEQSVFMVVLNMVEVLSNRCCPIQIKAIGFYFSLKKKGEGEVEPCHTVDNLWGHDAQ